ncbi:MAG: asparagine synthase (glutamine-hydrolyzing) [Gemmatimonadota bacterium]
MCGIAGLVGQGWDERELDAMVRALRHRGPDARGTAVHAPRADGVRVGLGHARLSILDLSDAGLQPMASASGRSVVVHNGEIYNYLELRSQLGGASAFRTGTDTEVLLAAYERWGDACVERFVGMFAFALWDRERQRLFCARDRLGIKPFHYGWRPDGTFAFGSEVRALLAAGVSSAPCLEAWATYLVHGVYDHDHHTFFEHVFALEPGRTLVLEGDALRAPAPGRARIRRWWSLGERAAEPWTGTFDEAADALRAHAEEAVRLRMRSDVAVGVNLSGGLDSAALSATLDALVPADAPVATFTAAFDDPAYDETVFAGAVPRNARWMRSVERVGVERCRALLQEVATHQGAPYGGVATIGYHALHARAREQDVTVLLEGQGVDELLAGYAYFRPLAWLDRLADEDEAAVAREAEAFGDDPARALARARAEVRGTAAAVYQDGSSHLRPDCVDPELARLVPEPPRFERPFPDHLRNAQYRDLVHTKLPRVLRMNDRLSMAHGRELREPWLDHRIVELCFRLPGAWKVGEGQQKRIFRHAFRDVLPADVRQAAKRAVVTPQREWLRGPFADVVRDALESATFRAQGWIRSDRAQTEFERFRAGEGDNAFFVWQWIMVAHQEWFR